jgi:tRNA dimethylallyltransferase
MMKRTSQKPKAVLIAGPTASGKSALAHLLASALPGIIINADSMQVYRELRILTARPSLAEERALPHWLYGTVGAGEPYSVARWLEDVKGALGQAHSLGRVPILVGGTGLYFEALTKGLAAIPPIPPEIREGLRLQLAEAGVEGLHAQLAAADPVMGGRLRPTDPQRILRALEVLQVTGRSLALWQAEKQAPPLLPLEETVALALVPPREPLYHAIDARFRRMVEAGALEEVRALMGLGLAPAAPALKALGVAPLAAHVAGELSLDAAIAAGQIASRHYAKRQLTWLRHKMISWRCYNAQYSESLGQEILAFVTDKG